MNKNHKNNWLSILYQQFTELVFPISCPGCQKEQTLICENCLHSLPLFAPSCFVCNRRSLDASLCPSCRKKTEFSHFYAPFWYGKNKIIQSMIARLKYKHVRAYSPILARALAHGITRFKITIPHNSVLVPIPLYKSRMLQRDFNQSALIAEELGKILNIPIAKDDCLMKKIKTKPQVSIENRGKRLHNVTDSFSVLDATDIFAKHVLLIDDVATTGGTLNAASQVLKMAGAKSVQAFTIAR